MYEMIFILHLRSVLIQVVVKLIQFGSFISDFLLPMKDLRPEEKWVGLQRGKSLAGEERGVGQDCKGKSLGRGVGRPVRSDRIYREAILQGGCNE